MVSFLLNLLLYISSYFLIIKCQINCPRNTPIYNTQKRRCVAEYCTQSQFDDGICVITNSLAETKWLNNITTISSSYNSQIFPSIAYDDEQNILLEIDENRNKKIFFSLEKNGNGYNNNSQFFYLENKDNNNFLYNNDFPQSYIATINSHRIYYSFSSSVAFFTYDLDTKIYSENNLENILGNQILSTYNSIMNTPDENIIIYAYLSTEYKLILQKIKLLSNGIEVIQTMKEETKSLAMNSCKCKFIKKLTNFIECLTMDENKVYTLRIYHSNFTFFKEYKFNENKASSDRAFYSFHEIINLNNAEQFFVMYIDITENGAKPIIIPKTFDGNDLVDISGLDEKYTLFSHYSYILSDTDNSMTVINDLYFALATLADDNKHLMILLINYVEGPSFYINYLDIYLKDLYNINYFSKIYTFPFNHFLGIGFIQENRGEYTSSFLIFGYPNIKNATKVNNIFLKYNQDGDVLHSIRLSDNIILENNLFCYYIRNIRFISLPDLNIGFILKNLNSQSILYKNSEISVNDNITISFSGDIADVKPGNYEIVYTQRILENTNLENYINTFDYREKYGNDELGNMPPGEWTADEFFGREMKLIIEVINCYNNCLTCTEESTNESNQLCIICKSGYYFEENTKNCYKYPKKGYYLKKDLNVFAKCYDSCETCDAAKEGNKSHCLSCNSDYLLYQSTNCLSCKKNGLYVDYEQLKCIDQIPKGYYINNSQYNTIDKCHENCGDCNKGPEGDNMNCEYCENLNNFYLIENTHNCQHFPYEGYYLTSTNKYRPCHSYCKNCTFAPTSGNTNCDYCNNKLGYFKESPNSKNCVLKIKEKMYYDEQSDNFLPCHENCLYCFDKETILTDKKTVQNCLNCKSQNKYVNHAQTECIDNIPEGFYVINHDTNEIDKCYPLCKTCHEKGSSENDMKCDSCDKSKNYFLYNGNCVLSVTCPNFFYYKKYLDDTSLDEEKDCLKEKEDCPKALPFYLKNNFECINSCSYDTIFERNCFIANLEAGLNKIFTLIYDKYKNENINFFEDFFSYVYNDKYNLVIKIKFFEFKGKSESKNIILEESIKRIDNSKYLNLGKNTVFEEQEVNLEKCLEKLNINYGDSTDATKLNMIKIDIKNINLNITRTYFKLFLDTNEKQKIDLSSCSSDDTRENIYITNINDLIYQKTGINISNISQNQEEEVNNNFTIERYDSDKCAVIYNEKGADIIYEDRIALFNQQFLDNIGNEMTISPDDIANNPYIYYIYEICPQNYKLIDFNFSSYNATCLNFFNLEDMINDINITKLFEANTYMNKNYIDISQRNTNGDYSIINSKLIILTIFDIIYLLLIIIYFSCYRKTLLFTKNKNESIEKIGIKMPYYHYPYKVEYQQKPKETPTYKKDMFSSLNSDILSMNNNNNLNNNIHNRNKSIHNLRHQKIVTISEDLTNRQNYYKTEKNNKNFTRKITDIIDDKSDLDLSEFLLALMKDKRNVFELFLSISQKKQLFILALKRDDNFIRLLRLSLLPFCIINYFTTNVFFFNDKVIHQIYLDEGSYNFSYQLKIICLSALISSIFLYLAKCIFIIKKNDINISRIIKYVDFVFILVFVVFIFYWIYVGSFTSVFIKSQKHICYNFLFTIVARIIYEIILTIISVCLRKIAIRTKSPNLYKFSVILILLKGG